jgi:MFS superfamily sulfate permease-like transporter
LLISAGSLAILVLSQKKSIRKYFGILPSPLIVVVLGAGLNILFAASFKRFALSDKQLVTIPSDLLSTIQFPDFESVWQHSTIFKDAFVIALLASLETLLSIEAIDKLDPLNRVTPTNRELIAQGIGNMCCGFLGALPVTAVIVRGSANVEAGARTRLSSFTHGMLLLAAVLLFASFINRIPYACLSAILLMTGYNLAKPALFKGILKLGWKQFVPFITTIVVILLTDLLIGVCTGLLVSVYYIIQNNLQEDFEMIVSEANGRSCYTISLHSNVTFLNKVKLRNTLEQIPRQSTVLLDGRESRFIDYDVLEIISEFTNSAEKNHLDVKLIDIEKVDTVGHH